MKNSHVAHSDIATFARDHVNLRREDVQDMLDQADRLRDKLEAHIGEHPELSFRKTVLSGSMAKGTALKDIDDIDLGLYITEGDAPSQVNKLIPWLAERLRRAFPNFKPEQVVENKFTVTVLYAVSGLKVDVVPIFYSGEPDWRGFMISKDDGSKILTSIPLHKKFISTRKSDNKTHYRQIVRLLKYWVKQRRLDNDTFRFKSFMVELLVAHLADNGLMMDDYVEALAQIFAYIAKDSFQTPIAFSDYYDPAKCKSGADTMYIWDPVNPENNVACRYDSTKRDAIISAALDAGDAVDAALHATTKGEAVRYWRKVFGTAFDA